MFYYWQIFSVCLNRISRTALIFPIFILVSMWTAGIVIFGWQCYYLLDVVALFSEREKTAFSFHWEVEIWKKMRSESLVWLLFSVLGGCGFKTLRWNLWFCLLIFSASRDSRNTHFNFFLMVVIVIVKVADICFTRFWDASVGWRL